MSDLIKNASEQLKEIIMSALGSLVSKELVPATELPAFLQEKLQSLSVVKLTLMELYFTNGK